MMKMILYFSLLIFLQFLQLFPPVELKPEIKKITEFTVEERSIKDEFETVRYKIGFTENTIVNLTRKYKVHPVEGKKTETLIDLVDIDKDNDLLFEVIIYHNVDLDEVGLSNEINMAELDDVLLEASEVVEKEPLQKQFDISPANGKKPWIERVIEASFLNN